MTVSRVTCMISTKSIYFNSTCTVKNIHLSPHKAMYSQNLLSFIFVLWWLNKPIVLWCLLLGACCYVVAFHWCAGFNTRIGQYAADLLGFTFYEMFIKLRQVFDNFLGIKFQFIICSNPSDWFWLKEMIGFFWKSRK